MGTRWRRIELVVVLGIFLLVIALLLPAVQAAREAARQTQCLNNLKIVAMGLLTYESNCRAFPYGTVLHRERPPEKRWSWYVGTWPYVLDGQVGRAFDLNTAWDTPENLEMKTGPYVDDEDPKATPRYGSARTIEMLLCSQFHGPATPSGISPTNYVGMAGTGSDAAVRPADKLTGVFGYDRQTTMSQITDGISRTILLMETNDQLGPWTAGGPSTVRGIVDQASPFLGPGRPFGGLHPQKTMAAMVDGSAGPFADGMDSALFLSLTTIAGEEKVPKSSALFEGN